MSAFPLSLYVHIPFCRSKCRYCDFLSLAIGGRDVVPWIETILDRAALCLRRLEEERGEIAVDSIFIGGGTPSILGPPQLERLLKGLGAMTASSHGPREWTVEANPESLDREKMSVLADSGVNRLSLGIQSLEDGPLATVGRPCDARRARQALDLISASWKGRWSADLMVGLPGQSSRGPERDAGEILAAGAGHTSLYTLILEEGTELARMAAGDPSILPDEDEAADAWEGAAALLRARGMLRYEVSNFALPGQECLHNLHYWRMDPWIGIGPSAVSTLPEQDGWSSRRTEGGDVDAWLKGGGALLERIDPLTGMKEWLMMGLRTSEGIEMEQGRTRYGIDAESLLLPLFTAWVDSGLARWEGGRFFLLDAGMDRLDALLRPCFLSLDGLVAPGSHDN